MIFDTFNFKISNLKKKFNENLNISYFYTNQLINKLYNRIIILSTKNIINHDFLYVVIRI